MSQTSPVSVAVSQAPESAVAVVTVNNPPVNVISALVRAGLEDALTQLESLPRLGAVVVQCVGSTFFSGADISEFGGPPQEEAFRRLFGRLEALPVPVVAAMHGTVLGGGLELSLACHYRVAAPETRFGFPELTLGLFPGAGGTQRMPRLIGIEKTLELILSARPISAAQARELGFLDEILTVDWRSEALAYARRLAVQGKGPRRTCECSVEPKTASDAVIERLTTEARKKYPHQSAPFRAIEVVRASARLPFAEGLEYETKLVREAIATRECQAAVHVFFAEREARRLPDAPAETRARNIQRAAVIGAGTMGSGIAICFANANLPVTLLEATAENLERGRAAIERNYESLVQRGRLTAEEKAQRLSLVRGTVDYVDLKDADVIVEAVFEDMELKKQVFRSLDQVAKPGAVLATNTSTLDITEIAAATKRPGDVIGMHFFSPANIMPLLEVVRTEQTSWQAIRTVMDLAKPLRKTPVLAKVCYGFIGNRMLEGYAREAERMVLEGATPRQVDTALEEWGMAMGILAVFDMAGVDVGVKIHQAHAGRFPPDPTYYQADAALVEAGRFGQEERQRLLPLCARSDLHAPRTILRQLAILRARSAQLRVPPRGHDPQEIVERLALVSSD